MPHPREWRCLQCRAAIGTFRAGVLVLRGGVPISMLGVHELRVGCPECGAVRTAVAFERTEPARAL